MQDPKFFCIFCTQALVRELDYQGSARFYYKCTACFNLQRKTRYFVSVKKPENDIIIEESIYPENSIYGLHFRYVEHKTYLLTFLRETLGESMKEIVYLNLSLKQKANITEQQIKLWLTFS